MKNIYLQLSKPSIFANSFLLFIGLLTSFFGVGQTTQTFNASGSWTVPCGVNSVTVQVWGAGGGGAGDGVNNAVSSGFGGGGGGYVTNTIAVTPGTSIPYTVGTGGTVSSGGNGGNGGNSSFSTIIANGGLGGTSVAVGTGGSGSGGTITNGSNGSAPSGVNGGNGGAGGNGGVGGLGGIGDGAQGSPGAVPGGGGGGSGDRDGGAESGGAGGNGRIIITFSGPNAGVDQTLAACATSTGLTANIPPATGSTGTWSCVSGCTGISFSNVNDPNATVSGLTIGVNPVLRWTWTGGGAGCTPISDDVVINTVAGPGCQTYCTSTWSNFTDEYISNVTFDGNSFTSTQTTNYTNNAGSCMNVVQGSSYSLSVNWQVSGAFPENVVAFIDWNGDGDFGDTGEVQLVGTSSTAGAQTGSITVTVPCEASVGNIRMRIILKFNAPAPSTGCESGTFGETEDYCLNITAATPPVADANPDQVLTCTSTATLDASGSVPAAGFWSLVSGTGTITNPTSPTSTVTGITNGTSVFEWTAVGTCATDADQVSISTSGLPNVPVSAGDDVFTCLNNELLSGSDPAPFTGQWTVSGPGTVTFSNDILPNSSVSFSSNGVYTFTWTVDAGACGFISEDMTFTFGSLPLPEAGPNQAVCPTNAVLNGNDFTGAVGTWSVVSGPGTPGFIDANDPNSMIYGLEVGSYELLWTVSGGGCAGTPSDNVLITVNSCTPNILHNATSDQAITGCNYTYTDNGGPSGNYTNNINQTFTTFCPDDPNAFSTITLTFESMLAFDYIVIYDSDSPGAPIVGGIWDGVAYPALNTTITSSTGCLYIQANSNASSVSGGWAANIGCSSTAGVQSQDYVQVNNCGGGGGITVCSSGPITAESNTNSNPPDLGNQNQGCLGSQEGASNTWVYINIASDGWLSFRLDPPGGQDYDYAIWGPYDGGYACPSSTRDEPIRCSWAANGGAGCNSNIGLGILNEDGDEVLPGDVSEGGFCNPAVNEGWTYPIYGYAGEVYVLLFQNYGNNNSTFDFAINSDASSIPSGESFAGLGCEPPQVLPIELVTFEGTHENRKNHLNWTTASESQNAYFIIEKSQDGQEWTELTRVIGAGFSNELLNYNAVDEHPFGKLTYYRLLQVDFDGTKRKYKTISIVTTPPEGEVFGDLYPNPTTGEFFFQYTGKNFNEPIQLSLVNGMGQVIMTNYYEEFNNSQGLNVDASGLARGTYLVKIQQGDKVEVKRLSVM